MYFIIIYKIVINAFYYGQFFFSICSFINLFTYLSIFNLFWQVRFYPFQTNEGPKVQKNLDFLALKKKKNSDEIIIKYFDSFQKILLFIKFFAQWSKFVNNFIARKNYVAPRPLKCGLIKLREFGWKGHLNYQRYSLHWFHSLSIAIAFEMVSGKTAKMLMKECTTLKADKWRKRFPTLTYS